jgi:hypothetical protein
MHTCSSIGNHRHDNDDADGNFFKRPPPKTTLMDFMTSLKISSDVENDKVKERPSNGKRRHHQESYPSTTKTHNSTHTANYSVHSSHYGVNNNHYLTETCADQAVLEQDGIDETFDIDDDPTHAIYRERRNPLPPR